MLDELIATTVEYPVVAPSDGRTGQLDVRDLTMVFVPDERARLTAYAQAQHTRGAAAGATLTP